MSRPKERARIKTLQFNQSQVFECPSCPDQKREGIEVAVMRDVSNRLVLGVWLCALCPALK